MHSRTLDYFEAIATRGSIRKAGEALHVAPSAINRHLIELEQSIGAPLFVRQPRGMQLTAAGEIMLLHVRTTLRDYRRAISEIEQLKTGTRGQVTVACIESALADVLPDVIHSFTARYPRTEIKVLGYPADVAVQSVLNGGADVCVIFNPPPRLTLVEVASATFPLGIVVARDHPLAEKTSVRLADLVGHHLVLPDESITIFDQVNIVLAGIGLKLQPRIVSSSLTFMHKYVERGGAVTIMTPVGVSRELRDGTLAFIPLRDRGIPAQRLVGGVQDASLPIAVANFCQHLAVSLPAAFLAGSPRIDRTRNAHS
jgi:DNA-binding transcriptional LysR family regulator